MSRWAGGMLRITRGMILHIDLADGKLAGDAGWGLSLSGASFVLWFTIEGACRADSGMVVNVTEIEKALRRQLDGQPAPGQNAVEILHWAWNAMQDKFENCRLERVAMDIHESLSIAKQFEEPEMIQVTTKYELAASHRLWNCQWDEDHNRQVFGKCSNPTGHGHNYLLEVTLSGEVDVQSGQVMDVEKIGQIVHEQIIKPFDHKNLNEDTLEFAELIPTVENMTRVFWDRLFGRFGDAHLELVRVWETSKTYAEYCGGRHEAEIASNWRGEEM